MIEVFIHVEKDGSWRVEVKGATGPQCKQLTQQVEKMLGVTTHVEEKPEFKLANTVQNKVGF